MTVRVYDTVRYGVKVAKTADQQSTQCPTEPEDDHYSPRPSHTPLCVFNLFSRCVNLLLWPLPCDCWLADALALTPPRTPALTSNFILLHPVTSAWSLTLSANQRLYLCSCSVHVVCCFMKLCVYV